MFTIKKREGINTFVCAVSLYVAETPKASIKDQEPLLPTIPFGIVAYKFVGQPFSKQLYFAVKGRLDFQICGKNPRVWLFK